MANKDFKPGDYATIQLDENERQVVRVQEQLSDRYWVEGSPLSGTFTEEELELYTGDNPPDIPMVNTDAVEEAEGKNFWKFW